MKFEFSKTEKEYLDHLVKKLIRLAAEKSELIWARKGEKVRLKLTLNTLHTNLKQAERGLLLFVLSERAVALTGEITSERDVIDSLIGKLSV